MLNLESTRTQFGERTVAQANIWGHKLWTVTRRFATNTWGRLFFFGVDCVTLMKNKLLIMFAAEASGSLLLSDVIDSNITVLPRTHTHTHTPLRSFCPLIWHLEWRQSTVNEAKSFFLVLLSWFVSLWVSTLLCGHCRLPRSRQRTGRRYVCFEKWLLCAEIFCLHIKGLYCRCLFILSICLILCVLVYVPPVWLFSACSVIQIAWDVGALLLLECYL